MLSLKKLKPDPIFGFINMFNNDLRCQKLNLTIGEYHLNNKLYKFEVVNKAESKLNNIEHSYLPIDGNSDFLKAHSKIVFPKRKNFDQLLKYQTLSGTGANNLSGHIMKLLGISDIYIPNMTWGNHYNVFEQLNISTYNQVYRDNKNILKLCEDNDLIHTIEKSKPNSCFVFQSCGHNPSGLDYNTTSLVKIAESLKQNNNYVVIDNAYQGLCSGNYITDANMITIFDNFNIPLLVASSCAKNLGLYGERIGSLICSLPYNQEQLDILDSHIKKIIRTQYTNPPLYGSLVAQIVYSDFINDWKHECMYLVNILKKNRRCLYESLKSKGIIWDDILLTNGLFYMPPLYKDQIINLREKYAIYTLENGRINIAKLDEKKIEYLTDSISEMLK